MTVRRVVPMLAALLLVACSLPGLPSASGGAPAASSGPTPTATPDPNTPEGVAAQFLASWVDQDYEAMYGLLSAESQADYAPESFTGIYTSTSDTMRLVEVKAEIDASHSESTPTTARVPYHATYYTSALGAIDQDPQMTLLLESGQWKILWSPQMIFPELVRGNTLDLLIESPERAGIYDRNGNWLVQSNSPTYTISVIPSLVGDEEDEARMLTLLSRILRIPEYQIQLNRSEERRVGKE